MRDTPAAGPEGWPWPAQTQPPQPAVVYTTVSASVTCSGSGCGPRNTPLILLKAQHCHSLLHDPPPDNASWPTAHLHDSSHQAVGRRTSRRRPRLRLGRGRVQLLGVGSSTAREESVAKEPASGKLRVQGAGHMALDVNCLRVWLRPPVHHPHRCPAPTAPGSHLLQAPSHRAPAPGPRPPPHHEERSPARGRLALLQPPAL